MFNKTKYKKNKLSELLEADELEIVKKLINLIGKGVTVGNFGDFTCIELYEFKLDSKLNYTITKLDDTYADKIINNIVVDRGASSRTGFGTLFKENGDWYFTDDLYLRYK